MPELPEVERVRQSLVPAMVGASFARVVLNRGDLRRPFPAGFAKQLRGQRVQELTRRGKYLLAVLSSGDTLIIHLGMSGWLRVDDTLTFPSADRDAALDSRHDHVIFVMSSGLTVTFNDPRRFGMMDLVSADRLPRHASLAPMGPEPLSRAFNARTLAARCAGRRMPLKVALLDQRIVAGLGNIYASEALHLARLSPFRPASTVATRSGAPRPAAVRLPAAIKAVLRRAMRLTDAERYRGRRFRVYDREGEACPTPGCRGVVARIWQAGRSTFYCPVCQRS
jgi:formamidopyrimidine-DNA glycosylase